MRSLLVLLSLLFTTIASAKPNILFVLIDDMGYSDMSCFGSTRVKTPNIDRLASEGIRFTQYYDNAPICSPSRVALTTGQYPLRWNITSYLDARADDKRRGIADWLDPKAPTLARILHENGYYTAHVGKWHMGGQRDVGDAPMITAYGFDKSLTSFEGLGERILPVWDVPPGAKPFHHTPTDMNAKLGGPITWVPRWKETQIFVDRAIQEMNNAKKEGKPFYINLWPDDVHSPNQAPPDDRGDGSPVANYLGVVREMDKQLGRVFDYLRNDPQLRDNTIVIVCSDNGPENGLGRSDGMRGSKGQLYEGGIRLPLITWSPAMIDGGKTNGQTVIAGMDLAPSVLAMTGASKSEDVKFDGVDMSSVMLSKSDAKRDSAVMWVRPPDRPGPKGGLPDLAIREGDWKLLIKRDGSKTELFDIVKDPGEKTNLAKDNPDVVEKMKKEVLDWEKATKPKH